MKAPWKIFALALIITSLFVFGCSENEEGNANKPEPDTKAPTVLASYPPQNAMNVKRNGPFWILFSEPMNKESAEGAVTTDFGYFDSWNGDTLFLTPTELLQPSTEYQIIVQTDAKDLAGNNLAAPYGINFTTNSAQDSVPPTIVSTNPANGATDVPGAQNIEITFSEPMEVWNTQQAVTLSPEPDVVDFDWNGTTLIIQHTSFGSNTPVTVTISTGAMDLAGNHLAAQYSFSFTTAEDNTRPYLASANPANNSTGVSRDISSIRFTFSEPMDENSFDNVDATHLDARFIQLIQEDPSFDPSFVTITINPAHRLLPGCSYWVSFYNVTDQAGNVIDPNPTPYTFTTQGTKTYFPFLDPNKWWYLSDGSTEIREVQNYNSSTGYFEIASKDETGALWNIEKLRYSSTDNTIYHLGVVDYNGSGAVVTSMEWDDQIPYIKLPVESHLGDSWEINSTGTFSDYSGPTAQNYDLTISATAEIDHATVDLVSNELEGTFKDCAVFSVNGTITIYDSGGTPLDEQQVSMTLYLAPCVGTVMQMDFDPGQGTTDTTYIYNWETQ